MSSDSIIDSDSDDGGFEIERKEVVTADMNSWANFDDDSDDEDVTTGAPIGKYSDREVLEKSDPPAKNTGSRYQRKSDNEKQEKVQEQAPQKKQVQKRNNEQTSGGKRKWLRKDQVAQHKLEEEKRANELRLQKEQAEANKNQNKRNGNKQKNNTRNRNGNSRGAYKGKNTNQKNGQNRNNGKGDNQRQKSGQNRGGKKNFNKKYSETRKGNQQNNSVNIDNGQYSYQEQFPDALGQKTDQKIPAFFPYPPYGVNPQYPSGFPQGFSGEQQAMYYVPPNYNYNPYPYYPPAQTNSKEYALPTDQSSEQGLLFTVSDLETSTET